MTQKTRLAISTLVMAALTAGGLLWVWFGVHEAGQAEEAREEAAARILPEGFGGITRLTFERPGADPVVVERTGEGEEAWSLSEPVRAPADEDTVDVLVERLLDLQRTAEVLPAGEVDDPALFGLAPAGLVVTVEATGGRRHRIALGDTNPFDQSVYLRKDEGPVVLVDGSIRPALDQSAFDLRERRLLRLSGAEVQRLSIRLPEQAYELTREGEAHWRVSGLVDDRADSAEVRRLLAYLQGLRVQDFPPKVLPKARLEAPTAEVQVGLSSGETVRVAFVQETQEDGEAVLYAVSDQLTGTGKLPADVVGKLERLPLQLRYKKVVDVPAGQIARITVRTPEQELVISRGGTGDDWRLVAPHPGEVARTRVDSLLYGLSDLTATDIIVDAVADPGQLAEYGLSEPGHTVTLSDAAGEALAVLHLGNSNAGGTRYATTGERARVYTVPTSRLHALPSEPADLALVATTGDAAAGGGG